MPKANGKNNGLSLYTLYNIGLIVKTMLLQKLSIVLTQPTIKEKLLSLKFIKTNF